MPGRDRLARELGINPKTVEAALNLLEAEGLLVAGGAGRRRGIVLPETGLTPARLRVAILHFSTDAGVTYNDRLRRILADSGHEASFVRLPFALGDLLPGRLERTTQDNPADAWVLASVSREVLQWFAMRPEPVFALFGNMAGLPIAGAAPNHVPALLAAMRRLISIGHRRIVLLVRENQRTRPLGKFCTAFHTELEANAIATGPYNFPDWKDTPAGLRRCLDSLFGVSPPTALIIDEPFLFAAVQQHLARRGLLAPEHVSLVCIDNDPSFSWLHPSIAHLAWNPDHVLSKVGSWAEKLARGESHRRQYFPKAKFVEGGTIGPAP